MTEIHQIEQELRQFLDGTGRLASHDGERAPEINSALSDPELRTRIAEFIEEKWNVAVSETDLTPQHLQTTECVARLIAAKALGSRDGGTMHCRELDAFRHIAGELTDGG